MSPHPPENSPPPLLKQPSNPPRSAQAEDIGERSRAEKTQVRAIVVGALLVGASFAVGVPVVLFYGDPHSKDDLAAIVAIGLGILAGWVGLLFGAVAGWIGFEAYEARTAVTRGAILGALPGVPAAGFVWLVSERAGESDHIRPLLLFILCAGAVALAARIGFNFSPKR